MANISKKFQYWLNILKANNYRAQDESQQEIIKALQCVSWLLGEVNRGEAEDLSKKVWLQSQDKTYYHFKGQTSVYLRD